LFERDKALREKSDWVIQLGFIKDAIEADILLEFVKIIRISIIYLKYKG